MASTDPPSSTSGITPNIDSSQQPSWPSTGLPVLSRDESRWDELGKALDIDLSPDKIRSDDRDASDDLNNPNTRNIPKEKATDSQSVQHLTPPGDHEHLSENPPPKLPFRKWVRSLKRRNSLSEGGETQCTSDDRCKYPEPSNPFRRVIHRRFRHRFPSSGSSLGFVTAVQSASTSLITASAAAPSRRRHGRSRAERSSRASLSTPRVSKDVGPLERAEEDFTATQRAFERRQILEELISTEESYIGDIRFLMNTYVNMLAALPSLSKQLRSSTNRNLHHILQLHDEILGDLHRVIPFSEYSQVDYPPLSKSGHGRSRGLKTLPECAANLKALQNVPGMLTDPQVAAEVAKVFSKKTHEFFIYKEYGAKFEMIRRDIAAAHQGFPEWEVHQKGVETLGFSVGSPKGQEGGSNKALTVNDLLIKDRLVFPDRRLDADSKNQIRSFGHIQLCGALHVCWETEAGVEGQYMICLLYKDLLCLASGGKSDRIYTILACIDLCNARVEDVDKGGGLRCHLAPFSWKLVFEGQHELYELVMSACSPNEETEWRSRLQRNRDLEQSEKPSVLYNFLSIDIKSLGAIFRRPGTISRTASVSRATTVPHSAQVHVILRNTSLVKSAANTTGPVPTVGRSHSLVSSKPRIPVLAPPRSERARLEVLLEDVWSRNIIPFPDTMSIARNEQLMRRSASTMMRKLSIASMAKRSGSISRKGSEEVASEGLTRQTSKSSVSSFSVFDVDGSRHSNSTKCSTLPEATEMGMEESRVADSRSSMQKLTLASRRQGSDLIETTSDTVDDDLKKEKTATQSPMTSSQKAEASPSTKENTRSPTRIPVRSKSVRWTRGGAQDEKKGHGLRRFFG
ncbi:hypothetical protein CEP51_009829 [Fusarium floridanum]|uniref:DH domain-containing protein n=1 Tax=Fusarium floridanum TaxID=1325733 RepID=A0A428RGD8_9HYPO|nr:hypothetical protein CEP51_009829 [Fusarium floridanum]